METLACAMLARLCLDSELQGLAITADRKDEKRLRTSVPGRSLARPALVLVALSMAVILVSLSLGG